ASVHPHARGDDPSRRRAYRRPSGTPPRAWGRRHECFVHHPKIRYTPTRVGTTNCAFPSLTTTPVHPHARGDDAADKIESAKAFGTPPRAWGRPHHLGKPSHRLRYTPTRVGTTLPNPANRLAAPVHPHARGDD